MTTVMARPHGPQRLVDAALGGVDGFDEDESKGESDKGPEVPGGLLAAQRDALEALHFPDQLLDAGARPVERLRKESRPVRLVGLKGDHRRDAAFARGRAVGSRGIALIADRSARRDVGPKVEQNLELWAVAGLTFREVERERSPIQVNLEVDLGREASARAAERLAVLPPLAPAAETWARTTVESNI
jgi:hypothetical protein